MLILHCCRLSISQLLNVTKPAVEEGETQTSYAAEAIEQHLSVIKEVHEKIEEIEVTCKLNLCQKILIHCMCSVFC